MGKKRRKSIGKRRRSWREEFTGDETSDDEDDWKIVVHSMTVEETPLLGNSAGTSRSMEFFRRYASYVKMAKNDKQKPKAKKKNGDK